MVCEAGVPEETFFEEDTVLAALFAKVPAELFAVVFPAVFAAVFSEASLLLNWHPIIPVIIKNISTNKKGLNAFMFSSPKFFYTELMLAY